MFRGILFTLVTWGAVTFAGLPNADAEWYVAGQLGPTFADRLSGVEGTNQLSTLRAPDFDLANSIAYGAKLGYFRDHGWVGIEGEAFHTTPHVKNLDDVAGIPLRVTTLALNFIVRYPGLSVQPYAGIGLGLFIAHLGDSPTTRSDSDVATGINVLAGVRFFLTPYVSMFTEYKLNNTVFHFDDTFGAVGGFAAGYTAQHLMIGIGYHF